MSYRAGPQTQSDRIHSNAVGCLQDKPMMTRTSFCRIAHAWLPLGIVVLAVIGGAIAIQIGLWKWRPMFHNLYAQGDRLPFYRWIVKPPRTDQRGNAVIADYRLNLLVVFLTADAGIDPTRFWFPGTRKEGVVFPSKYGEDDIDFFVPRASDKLMILQADGSREEIPLALVLCHGPELGLACSSIFGILWGTQNQGGFPWRRSTSFG